MAKRTTPIPISPLYKILRKVGANRVSEEAKRAFVEAIVDIAEKIATRAVELAKHAGRKTVHMEDIRLAKKDVWSK